jgi:PAS domain S-box-containing protein
MKGNPRILIVDDDESTRRTLSLIFGKNGYETETATMGQEALEKAQERFFNLALLDIKLPDMAGVELLTPLKEMHPDMEMIMATAYASTETAVWALNEGASAYINKPLNMDEVLAMVTKALEKQRLVREKRRAEESLRESEERYRAVVENSHNGVLIVRADYTFDYVNDKLCEILGRRREEIMGHDFTEFLDEDSKELVRDRYVRRRTGEDVPPRYEFDIVRKDGEKRRVEISSAIVRDSQGRVRTVAQILDITERKRAEEALEVSARQWEVTFNAISDAVWLADQDGRILQCNSAMTNFLERSLGEIIGRPCWELVHGTSEPIEECPFERMRETRGRENLVFSIDGRWLDDTVDALLDEDDNLVGAVHVLTDITDRKRAEEERQHHLERIEALREIDQAITSTLDLNEVLDIILEELASVIPYHSAAIFLLSNGTAKVAAARGQPDLAHALEVSFPIQDDTLIAKLMREERSLVLADAQAEKRFLARGGTDYVRSWMGIPLIAKERAVGFLTMDHREPHVYDEESARLAQAFAGQVAIAIENAQLYERTQQHLQRTTALRSIDMAIAASLDLGVTLSVILDQVTKQLGVDAADILLHNSHTQTLEYALGRGFRSDALQHTRLRLGEGYAGRAALERCLVTISNLAEDAGGLAQAPLMADEGFVTYFGVPLIAKGQIQGVLEIFRRAPLQPDQEWLDFLETLARQVAIAIDNARLFENLQRSNVELTLAYDTTLEGWARALELRDYETEGHAQRVVDLTTRLARIMGINQAELVDVRRGALLHDIGKLAVPDTILLKPGSLTEDEWCIMRQHPVYAYEMLLPITYLNRALDIPHYHHEKWDGTGYPKGLKGEQIPLAARIFAVVDVWDALRSDRPYRDAWPDEKALAHIREQAGKHFDPRVVNVFLKTVSEEQAANESG